MHFATDVAIVGLGIERLDRVNASDTIFQARPERFDVVTDGGDRTHSGDDDAATIVHEM